MTGRDKRDSKLSSVVVVPLISLPKRDWSWLPTSSGVLVTLLQLRPVAPTVNPKGSLVQRCFPSSFVAFVSFCVKRALYSPLFGFGWAGQGRG
jgi:hypothetical protein